MTPAKRILDPTFEYIDAANTDIRKRFERVRKELAAAKAVKTPPNVRTITQAKERKA